MADINSCIVLYDPVSKTLQKSSLVIPENIIPMNITFGYSGEIWIGSQKGLISVRNENTPFKVLVHTEASEEINPFISIFVDKAKHLWSSRYFKNKIFTDNHDYEALFSKIASSNNERIWDFSEDEKYYFVLSSGKISQIEKGTFRQTEIVSTSKIDNSSYEFLSMLEQRLKDFLPLREKRPTVFYFLINHQNSVRFQKMVYMVLLLLMKIGFLSGQTMDYGSWTRNSTSRKNSILMISAENLLQELI
jgi:hypothetical protein